MGTPHEHLTYDEAFFHKAQRIKSDTITGSKNRERVTRIAERIEALADRPTVAQEVTDELQSTLRDSQRRVDSGDDSADFAIELELFAMRLSDIEGQAYQDNDPQANKRMVMDKTVKKHLLRLIELLESAEAKNQMSQATRDKSLHYARDLLASGGSERAKVTGFERLQQISDSQMRTKKEIADKLISLDWSKPQGKHGEPFKIKGFNKPARIRRSEIETFDWRPPQDTSQIPPSYIEYMNRLVAEEEQRKKEKVRLKKWLARNGE